MTSVRVRKSWRPKRNSLAEIKDKLVELVTSHYASGDSFRYVIYQWGTLAVKIQALDTPYPILLLADSMFTQLKPSTDMYPIAHSGERLEQLLAAVPILSVKARAVVLNHGLNHIRNLGPEQTIKDTIHELYKKLHAKYPTLELYHLQPPISPSFRHKSDQVENVRKISVMMANAGFITIPHPELRDKDFGGDRFHYSRPGCRKVGQHVLSIVG
jgi:hypothetical protein